MKLKDISTDLTISFTSSCAAKGPPGTGKTAVSVELLKAWATQDNGDGGPTVLACSDSNIAVDNLLAGLIKAGVKAVRVGRPETTSPELLEYSVDAVGAEAAALARTNSKDVAHAARQRAIKGATVLCATCVGECGCLRPLLTHGDVP